MGLGQYYGIDHPLLATAVCLILIMICASRLSFECTTKTTLAEQTVCQCQWICGVSRLGALTTMSVHRRTHQFCMISMLPVYKS